MLDDRVRVSARKTNLLLHLLFLYCRNVVCVLEDAHNGFKESWRKDRPYKDLDLRSAVMLHLQGWRAVQWPRAGVWLPR